MRIGTYLAMFGAGILFGACTGMHRDGTAAEASGLTAVQFRDVPVPDGMVLQTGLNESHSYEAGRFRFADLYYYGNLPVAEIAEYMKRRMALHGWQLVEETGGRPAEASAGAGDDPATARSETLFERAPNRVRCEVWLDSSGVTRMHVEVRTPAAD